LARFRKSGIAPPKPGFAGIIGKNPAAAGVRRCQKQKRVIVIFYKWGNSYMHRTKPFPTEKACAAAYKVFSKSPKKLYGLS
jgi:hypothetical protein